MSIILPAISRPPQPDERRILTCQHIKTRKPERGSVNFTTQTTPEHKSRKRSVVLNSSVKARAGFLTLYYTGLRTGELLALEYGDINFKDCSLTVNKSFQRIGNRDVITPPKTPNSVRTIFIPEFPGTS